MFHQGDEANAKEVDPSWRSVREAGDKQENDQVSFIFSFFDISPFAAQVCQGVGKDCQSKQLQWYCVRYDIPFHLFILEIIDCTTKMPDMYDSVNYCWPFLALWVLALDEDDHSSPSEIYENRDFHSFPLRLSVLRRPSRWFARDRGGHHASFMEVSLRESQFSRNSITL